MSPYLLQAFIFATLPLFAQTTQSNSCSAVGACDSQGAALMQRFQTSGRINSVTTEKQNAGSLSGHRTYTSNVTGTCDNAIGKITRPQQDNGNSLISTLTGSCDQSTTNCSKIIVVGGDADGVTEYAMFLNALVSHFTDVSEIMFLTLDDSTPYIAGGDANCQGGKGRSSSSVLGVVDDSCSTNSKAELKRSLAQLEGTQNSFMIVHSTGFTFVAALMSEEPNEFRNVQTVILTNPLIKLSSEMNSNLLMWMPTWLLRVMDSFLKMGSREPLGSNGAAADDLICGTCAKTTVHRYFGHLVWLGDRMRIAKEAISKTWRARPNFRIFRLESYDNINSVDAMKSLCDKEQKELCSGETTFPGKTMDPSKDRWYHNLLLTTKVQQDQILVEIQQSRAISSSFSSDGKRIDRKVSDFSYLATNVSCNPW